MVDGEPDPELAERLRLETAPLEVSAGLRARTVREVAAPAPRRPLWSLATGWRRLAAGVGVVALGTLLIAAQGIRKDLDASGWMRFAMAALPMLGVGLFGLRHALAPRGWPVRWLYGAVLMAWAWMIGWSALGPWPGMSDVPLSQHLYCFGMTSLVVVGGTIWAGLFERGRYPVPWRVAMAAASSGLVAFAAQSVFCRGIDVVHLVVGHGGAAVVWGLLAGAAVVIAAR